MWLQFRTPRPTTCSMRERLYQGSKTWSSLTYLKSKPSAAFTEINTILIKSPSTFSGLFTTFMMLSMPVEMSLFPTMSAYLVPLCACALFSPGSIPSPRFNRFPRKFATPACSSAKAIGSKPLCKKREYIMTMPSAFKASVTIVCAFGLYCPIKSSEKISPTSRLTTSLYANLPVVDFTVLTHVLKPFVPISPADCGSASMFGNVMLETSMYC